jgi:hypothetical protein
MYVFGACKLIAPLPRVTLLTTRNFMLKIHTYFSQHYYLSFKMLNLAWLYHSGDVYDHYVAPNHSIEYQFDYDQNHSENPDDYNTEIHFIKTL